MNPLDSLMTGLTPLEAQAFYQNRTLRPDHAIQLAMSWMEAGENHVDVAVVATSEACHWDELKRDFSVAIKALGIRELPPHDAELIRLNRLLIWVRSHPRFFTALTGEFFDQCPRMMNEAGARGEPQTGNRIMFGLHRIYWHCENYYDRMFESRISKAELAALLEAAMVDIDELLALIADDSPALLKR